jgi:hypothetical protein
MQGVSRIIRSTGERNAPASASAARKSASSNHLIIKQARFRPGKRRVIGGSHREAAHEGRAELISDGDDAVGLRVVCACGKVMEFYFEYGE